MGAHSYDYAIIRVVPRVDREEFLNAGAIVYCRALEVLVARIALDRARFAAAFPGADLNAIEAALAVIPRICAGDPAAGPIAALPLAERFHWLVSPRSTIAQTSPAHSGLCDDPLAVLDHLMATLVA